MPEKYLRKTVMSQVKGCDGVKVVGILKSWAKVQIGTQLNIVLPKNTTKGPWWWLSGQRACLLLRRSEFKYC